MKVDIVLEKLQKNEFLDKRNIYIYASLKNILGGIMGSISGLVLLCVYEKFLYIHHANIDNSYDERLAKIYIPNMKNIQGKAGLFGGKFFKIMKGKNINSTCHQRPENMWIFS